MSSVSIRNLDSRVKEKLRLRAAAHGRSMEAEIRVILADTVRDPSESDNPFVALLDRFKIIGGVELELPPRIAQARGADLSA